MRQFSRMLPGSQNGLQCLLDEKFSTKQQTVKGHILPAADGKNSVSIGVGTNSASLRIEKSGDTVSLHFVERIQDVHILRVCTLMRYDDRVGRLVMRDDNYISVRDD